MGGYYQDLDGTLDPYNNCDCYVKLKGGESKKPTKFRSEISHKDPGYDELSERYDSTTKAGKRKFCSKSCKAQY